MSVVPSLSTVLSLLSFLTTVFALARVGAAAFSANQHQHQAQRPWPYAKAAQPAANLLQLQLGGPGSSMSLAQAIRLGVAAEGEKEKGVGYIGGHDLVRWTGNAAGARRPSLLFRPRESSRISLPVLASCNYLTTPFYYLECNYDTASPFPDHAKPLSMAKLIMSRHVRGVPHSIHFTSISNIHYTGSKTKEDQTDPHLLPHDDRRGFHRSRRRSHRRARGWSRKYDNENDLDGLHP